MGQAVSKRKDINVQLNDELFYNVSKFLRKNDAKSSSHNRKEKLNEFTQLLDARVFIDTNDSRYSHIYQGIDTIVKRVMVELAKVDPKFAYVKLRRTGSSTSGVKVGLPHEADYVLELPQDTQWRSGQLLISYIFKLIKTIVTNRSAVLTAGLPHWIIYGTKVYPKIGGVCLVMECRACANNPGSERVGVTVDLVPAHKHGSKYYSMDVFNENAATFLPYNLDTYVQKGEVYRLLREDDCDTGFIENSIMAQLPEEIKQSFRVAKFLLLNLNTSSEIAYDEISTLPEKTRLKLYGRKSLISSYMIRVLFHHLYLNIYGTKAEQRLKGGLLVLCLIDMVVQCVKSFKNNWTQYMHLKHPLIVNWRERNMLIGINGRYVHEIMRTLEIDTPAKLVERFNLLINLYAPISEIQLR